MYAIKMETYITICQNKICGICCVSKANRGSVSTWAAGVGGCQMEGDGWDVQKEDICIPMADLC